MSLRRSLNCLPFTSGILYAMFLTNNVKPSTVAATGSSIRQPTSIVLLCVSAASAVGFVYWMKYQVKRGKPALIPNYLWQKKAFSVICIMVFLAVGVLNTFEYNFSL